MDCTSISRGEFASRIDNIRETMLTSSSRYEIMYDEVLKAILENYPELDPEELKFVFPHWETAPKIGSA